MDGNWGLNEVNDQSFMLFREIELTVQSKLHTRLRGRSSADTENVKLQIVKEVASDNDVLFYWSLLSTNIR